VVLGPNTKRSWAEIERHKEARTLLVLGETGTGKELACRHFHQSSTRAIGPYVPVNCAAIPPNLAERLFFGTRKGADSSADAAAEGYLQAADGGTLFFDEIGELELPVQSKLLRVIETEEVLPLGASRPTRVDVTFCAGTHRDLRALANRGLFREDLLYRVTTNVVQLAPLRRLLEEIPWLIHTVLQKRGGPLAHVSFVEKCLCRDWPGNVRELVAEVFKAASTAELAGRRRIEAADLSSTAGQLPSPPVVTRPNPAQRHRTRKPTLDRRAGVRANLDRADIVKHLRQERGNVARAARAMGMHRTQLRRLIAFYQIDENDL
jgi:DNA-binding NtrC family response regulator